MIDYNCFCGNWPFHKIRKNTFEDILKLHKENGITGGYISSLESIFYNDPFEAEKELYQQIKGSGYKHVMTINPTLDTAKNTLLKGIKEFGIKGVRFTPGYHNYSLKDDCVEEIIKILKENNLPLFITMHFEDERMYYVLKYQSIETEDFKYFFKKFPDIVVYLCNIKFNELMMIKEDILSSDNIFFDISGVKGTGRELCENNLSTKVKFGSMAPIFCLKSLVLSYNELITILKEYK